MGTTLFPPTFGQALGEPREDPSLPIWLQTILNLPGELLDPASQRARIGQLTQDPNVLTRGLGKALETFRVPLDLGVDITGRQGPAVDPTLAALNKRFSSDIQEAARRQQQQAVGQAQQLPTGLDGRAQIPEFVPSQGADFSRARGIFSDLKEKFGKDTTELLTAPTLEPDPSIDPQVFRDIFAQQQQGLAIPKRDTSADTLNKLTALFAGAQQGLQGKRGIGAAIGGFGTGAAAGVGAVRGQIRKETLQNQKDMRQSQLALANAQFNMEKAITDANSFQIEQRNKQTKLDTEFELKNIDLKSQDRAESFKLAIAQGGLEQAAAQSQAATARVDAQRRDTQQFRAEQIQLQRDSNDLRVAALISKGTTPRDTLALLKAVPKADPFYKVQLADTFANDAISRGNKPALIPALAYKIAGDPAAMDILFPPTTKGNKERDNFNKMELDRQEDFLIRRIMSELNQVQWDQPGSLLFELGKLGDSVYQQSLILDARLKGISDPNSVLTQFRGPFANPLPSDINPNVSTARRR